MTDILEPTPLCEFYAVVKPDGTCRLVDTKLDVYESEHIGLIYRAAMIALAEWAARHGAHVGFIVGDGGPDYIKLKARLYEQAEELAMLRAREEMRDA